MRRYQVVSAALALGIAVASPAEVLGREMQREAPRVQHQALTDGPPALFVHGWKGEGDPEQEFTDLAGAILKDFPGRLRYFRYYQDLDQANGASCDGVQAEPSPDPTAGMPSPDRPGTNYCDSESDMAYNVVLLKQAVLDLYDESDDHKVVLIGNSMGAAIIRGLLSYSAALNDGVADNLIDSVTFMEGAHDGARKARIALAIGGAPWCLMDEGSCEFAAAVVPPAIIDFAAESDWYHWANPEPLPVIPKYNFFGDIKPTSCLLWTDFCFAIGDSVGDGLLEAGSDDPFDVYDGGARFLDGSLTAQNWQWAMGEPIKNHLYPSVTGFSMTPFDLESNPAFHGNFEANLNVVDVIDCASIEPCTRGPT